MNIMMVHPHDLFDSSEPWTIRIKCIADELAKSGNSVRLCYFPLEPLRQDPLLYPSGVELIALDRTLSPKVFIKNIRRFTVLSRWSDVIHFQKSHSYAAIPAVIAAFINKKPLHYDWDDWEAEIFYESSKRTFNAFIIYSLFNLFERSLPYLVDTVSVASESLKSLTLGFGKKEPEIFAAPVGVDLKKFDVCFDGSAVRSRIGAGGPIVLYVGQLHGAQYVDLLIQAAGVVKSTRPDVRFVIVGEGFMLDKLSDMRDKMGLKENVIFTGSVSHDEIPFYMAASDVCVAVFKDTKVTRCKSPLKIAEYMACGKAIVASDVGEIGNMLKGCGLLVKAGDHEALACGILTLIDDAQQRQEMGRAARKRAEEYFNWKFTAANLSAAYKKAICNGASA